MLDDSIYMETIVGDSSRGRLESGLMGKLFGARKRLITGESLFMATCMLAATKGVSIGVGFFGGFIMQKLEGDGMAFVYASRYYVLISDVGYYRNVGGVKTLAVKVSSSLL